MSGRSRRVVQNKSATTVASALAQLNAARSGAKRLDTFELKEEKAVYDVVDDEQYAQLVTKRRIEAGVLLTPAALPGSGHPGATQHSAVCHTRNPYG